MAFLFFVGGLLSLKKEKIKSIKSDKKKKKKSSKITTLNHQRRRWDRGRRRREKKRNNRRGTIRGVFDFFFAGKAGGERQGRKRRKR